MVRAFVFGFKKILIALSAFILLCGAAFAQESLITSVTISKPKELNGAYKLTVKADKPVEYKAKAENSDSIYFDLKNALTVDNVDTIYDDVSGIDAVIVQQLENSKVRIYVNGINTSSTQLAFKTSQQTGSGATNELVLNRPIREYRPTNNIDEIAQEDIDWNDNSFNPEHLLGSFFGIFDGRGDMTLVICLVLLVASVVVSRKVFAKVKLQEEPLIGLSSAYQKNNEEEKTNPLDTVYKEAPALRRVPQTQTRPSVMPRAMHSVPSYQRPQRQVLPQRNAIKQNYALGAYQNAQKNPYATPVNSQSQVAYQKRVQKPASQFVSRPVQKEAPKMQKQQASIENIKFLESVTRIYEQSGRKDLAQGLRAGINNRKTAV